MNKEVNINYISSRAAGKTLRGDGFQAAAAARAAKASGHDVLDATLGTFIYDDGGFHGFNTVRSLLSSAADEDNYSYAPITGGDAFKNAVLNWVFGAGRGIMESHFSLSVMPTPGGTGAISSTVPLLLDSGQTLLIPDLSWGPYSGIARNYGAEVEYYRLFSEETFNIEDFRTKCDGIIEKQKKLVFIINDPCHNPSGYTISPDELLSIINYLNEKQNIPVVFIYDIAYLDYAGCGREETRKKLQLLTKLKENIIIALTFSASKSFCVYGQRLGAQILMSKNSLILGELYEAETFYARHCWSNTNRGIITMMTAVDRDSALKAALEQEIDGVSLQLRERSKIFFEEARAAGLKTHPYDGGFFIAIPCAEPGPVLERLRENEYIYLLAFYRSVRLALCAVPKHKVYGLVGTIKNYL